MSSTSIWILDIRNKLLSSSGIMFMIIGTVGNLLNIILFKQRHLRKVSPCITFLLASSVVNLAGIYSFILLRTLIGFKITPTFYSPIFCKLQAYLYYTSFCLSSWYMVACCVDRFFASSQSAIVRGYSNIRTTRRALLIITIILPLVYFPVLYCFDANQFQKPAPCYLINRVCEMIDLTNYFIFQSIGPPVCMLIFGIGTFIHIRPEQRVRLDTTREITANIMPATSLNSADTRKNRRSILYMLIAQVILYIICSLPLLAFRIYSIIPLSSIKSDVRLSAENLILHITIVLNYVDKIFSFYIYTLTSEYFRSELIKLVSQCCQTRRIEPQH